MIQDEKNPVTVEDGPKSDDLFVVFATIADTTWRMFVPVIVGVLVGLWIDGQYHTEYGAVVGSVVGLALSGVLVWDQYVRSVKGSKK